MMKKIRLGQIGIGHNHGEAKMKAARKFPELFEIIGYAEEDEQWIEKRGGSKGYESLARMSVEEIINRSDAILIESDVWNLTKYAQMCVDAGKHIHVDKPASGTLNEWKRVLDTAKSKELIVQLGYMYRYNPSIKDVFRRIQGGELGTVHSIVAEMSTYHSDEYRKWLNHFAGGNMYIFGSHLVDLILLLMGEPKKIQSHIGQSGVNEIYAPDLSAATLIYDNAIARIFVSSVECNGWGRRCFSVAGSEGTIEIRPLEVPVKMTFAQKGSGQEYFDNYAIEQPCIALPDDQRYDEMMEEFYSCINGEKPNPYTYEHEYLVQKVLLEIVGGVNFNGKDID